MVPTSMIAGLGRSGVEVTPLRRAADTLSHLLDAPATQSVAVSADWRRLSAAHAERRPTRLFDALRALEPLDAEAPTPQGRAEVLAALPAERRANVLTQLEALLREVVSIDGPIDPGAGLFDVGLDSLGSTEFRRRLETTFEISTTQTLLFEHGSLDAVADVVLEAVTTEPPEDSASPPDEFQPPDHAEPDDEEELDGLDELAVVRRLQRRLDELDG